MIANPLFQLHVILVILSLMGSAAYADEGKSQAKHDPYPAPRAPLVTLVEDGRPRCTIIAPAKPSTVEAHAVRELIEYVRRITGVKLPVADHAPAGHVPLYLGSAARGRLAGVEWKDLGSDGFVLSSGPSGLDIAGARDLGTLYGTNSKLTTA